MDMTCSRYRPGKICLRIIVRNAVGKRQLDKSRPKSDKNIKIILNK
jgi:hypothetical protein